MKPNELQIDDLILGPFYGLMVPSRVVSITKDRIMYEPLHPGPHRPGPYVSNGENLAPIKMDLQMFIDSHWNTCLENNVWYATAPIPGTDPQITVRWYQQFQCVAFAELQYNLPVPITALHEFQHILRILGVPSDFNL